MRAETGPIQFGDDWPGVFIRGKDAFYFLKVCEALVAGNPLTQAGLDNLKGILESSDQRVKATAIKMKSFGDCMEEG